MRKIYCCLGLIITLPAFGENLSLTTLEYVEEVLDDYQDKFELDDYTNGAETLVTIDSTEDSGINQMPIATSVGTNENDNAHVPTTGAVVTGLNGRQTAVVNISNQNIVTYSGTNGTITATPIYNSTNNTFSNGLVTAGTLNSAVSDAANSKVTCYQHVTQNDPTSDCLLWQIHTTPTAPLTTTVNLPANVAGTTYCRKAHNKTDNNDHSDQGSCSNDVYNALNNGEWATVFSYGTVRGISMCTNISSSVFASIPTNQSGIQTAYDNWVSSGRPSAASSFAGGYCYCKVTEPSVSAARWVFRDLSSVSGCASYCANFCAYNARNFADFRGALFSAQ